MIRSHSSLSSASSAAIASFETKSGHVFVPFTSMIVVSLLLTLVLNLFFRR